MVNTVFFDLDGTLAPFIQDEFIRSYFGTLTKRLAPLGYKGDELIAALWKGTAAMIRNNGSNTNDKVFWEVFVQELGPQIRETESILNDFYTKEFDSIRTILVAPTDRRPLIQQLRAKGYSVVLATNPIFPAIAVETRLNWVGLHREDFDYVTTYENSRYSKPNPEYYKDILAHIGKTGAECLMVGNNPVDDMASLKAGLDAYLVTDCIENPDNLALNDFRHGTFQDLEKFLAGLQKLSFS